MTALPACDPASTQNRAQICALAPTSPPARALTSNNQQPAKLSQHNMPKTQCHTVLDCSAAVQPGVTLEGCTTLNLSRVYFPRPSLLYRRGRDQEREPERPTTTAAQTRKGGAHAHGQTQPGKKGEPSTSSNGKGAGRVRQGHPTAILLLCARWWCVRCCAIVPCSRAHCTHALPVPDVKSRHGQSLP